MYKQPILTKQWNYNIFVQIYNNFAPVSSMEFLDIQATVECGFTLKHVRVMIRTYSQRDKYMGSISFKVLFSNHRMELCRTGTAKSNN